MARHNEKFYVNELDDVDAAGWYMVEGCRVAPRGLAKRLPHTSRDLVDRRVTPEQVTSTLMLGMDFVEKNAEAKRAFWHHVILDATRGIAAGLHERYSCWECSALQGAHKSCSGCGVACYCSKDCQKAAWKSGHKQKCKDLGARFKLYEESLRVVDEAHSTGGGVMHGIALCDEADYDLISFVFASPTSGEVWDKLGEPSMSAFYENLGRAARGEWWLWESVDKPRYSSVVTGSGKERGYFKQLMLFMCFDFSGATCTRDADRATALRAYEAFKGWIVEEHGAAMPAEIFVLLYKGASRTMKPVDRQRVRTQTDYACRDSFKKAFHK